MGALSLPAAAQPRSPSFRAAVRLVSTDVVAVDRDGRAVSDLRPQEFVLEQDGEPQQILHVEHVRTSGPRPGDRLGPASTQGRTLVFVVDDEHMRPEHAARTREGLVAVLPGLWREGDAATIATTALDRPDVPAVVHSLDDLLAQVDTIRSVGRLPASRLDPFADCFGPLSDDPLGGGVARGTLEPVERILAMLPATGRRTLVLLLTDGIVDARCPSARYSAEERLRRLADCATRRNAVIYGLMTTPFSSGAKMPEHRGPTADAARRPPTSVRPESVVRGYLRTIAERTGGFAVRSNDIGEMVARAVGDQDGYYVLTYEPPEGTFTTGAGRHAYRRLRVRCSRNDVTCRGRSGFYSVADDLPAGASVGMHATDGRPPARRARATGDAGPWPEARSR